MTEQVFAALSVSVMTKYLATESASVFSICDVFVLWLPSLTKSSRSMFLHSVVVVVMAVSIRFAFSSVSRPPGGTSFTIASRVVFIQCLRCLLKRWWSKLGLVLRPSCKNLASVGASSSCRMLRSILTTCPMCGSANRRRVSV